MNAHIIPFPSPFQPQHDQDADRESFSQDSFVSRAAGVDRLIDAKARFVMERERLCAFVESNPAQGGRYHSRIQSLEGSINRLQEQIDQELKGLLQSLQNVPVSSRARGDVRE